MTLMSKRSRSKVSEYQGEVGTKSPFGLCTSLFRFTAKGARGTARHMVTTKPRGEYCGAFLPFWFVGLCHNPGSIETADCDEVISPLEGLRLTESRIILTCFFILTQFLESDSQTRFLVPTTKLSAQNDIYRHYIIRVFVSTLESNSDHPTIKNKKILF